MGDGGRGGRLRTALQAGAILALVFACYYPSLHGEFLWDDDSNVSENPTLRSLDGLRRIWASPFANQQFYPLTHTSFWVEHQLWGPWPTGFRITNVALHGLVAVLLWTALRRLSVPAAWGAATIFALHPVHVESVAWITERKNLLSAVLYFGALLAYLRFAGLDGRRRPGWSAWALSLGLFACALLAKTAVLTLPLALLVLVWWKKGPIERRDALFVLPMLALSAAFGLITAWLERGHVGAGGPAWDLSPGERLIVAGRAFWFYASKLVAPIGLNFLYPRWSVDGAAAWQFLFPLSAVALCVVLWRLRGRIGRGPLAGVLVFGITVAPALGFLDFYFQLYSWVQDHFQYLASVGPISLLAASCASGLRRVHRHAPAVALAAVLALLGGLARERCTLFVDDETLWTATLERNPRAWMADINLGLLYEEQGRLVDAEARFRHALETPHSEHGKARYNLGRILEQLGRDVEAREQYALAIEADPSNVLARNNLGNLLLGEDDVDGAIAHYRAALEASPTHPTSHYNLALALARRGDAAAAERHLREAVRLDPAYADAWDVLGCVLDEQGLWEEAVESYERALAIDPQRDVVHYNLGRLREHLGDPDAAVAHYVAAIRINPDRAEAYNNLAIVLYGKRRCDEAWQAVRGYERLGGVPHPGFLEALAANCPR
jgi:tetratricopeptide (TPR) repeat protein